MLKNAIKAFIQEGPYMNEGIKKFEELLRTDESFKAKLQAAAEAYTGEENEEAVFNGVLLPVAKEYGISASYEELKDYIGNLASTDEIMDEEELKQIAGSKGGGFGAGVCYGVGIGCFFEIQIGHIIRLTHILP